MISLWAGLTGLFLISIVHNAGVDFLRQKSHGVNPYTSLLVVLGVAYTVVAALLIDYGKYPAGNDWFLSWQTLIMCFVASGVPMVWGDIARYFRGL